VAVAPKSAEARIDCARAYRRLGDSKRQELALRAAVELDAKDPVAHNALGAVLAAGGRLGEARGHFERAAELAPTRAWPVHNLAILTGRDLDDPEMAGRYRKLAAELVAAGAEPPPKGCQNDYWTFFPEEEL
jgi:Flp pilus assembly protein TadD